MDELSKFAVTQLPSKEDFYSQLSDQHISDEDYAHAQKVWDTQCANLGEYHDIYLKSDVLLADVFENFRNVCLAPTIWSAITAQRLDYHGAA